MKKELISRALSEYNINQFSNVTAVDAKMLSRTYVRDNIESEILKLVQVQFVWHKAKIELLQKKLKVYSEWT